MVHKWITDRDMSQPALVLRIDDYGTHPLARGQFAPVNPRMDDSRKAIWPDWESAHRAAEWAVEKFGHVYGVFTMVEIVEHEQPPIKSTLVGEQE